jgi:hypothetical protein
MKKLGAYISRHHLALLALFVALGGTSYAAVNLPVNSVGTKQLKRNAVTAKKIRKDAVTGIKIKDNAVKGVDVAEASLAEVPNAGHARNADRAANATNADRASTAANASHADSATNATSAGHATTSSTASNALALGGIGIHQLMFTPHRSYHTSAFLSQSVSASSNYQVNVPGTTVPLGSMRLSCSDPAQVTLQWVNNRPDAVWVWIDSGAATPTFATLQSGEVTPPIVATDPDHFTFFVGLTSSSFGARIDVWMRTTPANRCDEMLEVVALGQPPS